MTDSSTESAANENVKIWVLTPENISEYASECGADEAEILLKYEEAQSRGKTLYGYINHENLYWE